MTDVLIIVYAHLKLLALKNLVVVSIHLYEVVLNVLNPHRQHLLILNLTI
jgi:hypothetical protein